jgi:hypothetical protein
MRIFALAALVAAFAGAGSAHAAPENYLYVSADEFDAAKPLLRRSDIDGIQILFSWSALEPEKDRYDFAEIERDLAFAQSLHKQLFIQLQDRSFADQWKPAPPYLQHDPAYDGGVAHKEENPGWIAMQWNPAVRDRFQHLLKALAARFDGRIRGINFPETAADLKGGSTSHGFTCDTYFAAELENAAYAKSVFHRSAVVLYANFWPCEWANDRHYMQRTFDFAVTHHVGLGGPDVLPFQKPQMNNSYGFLHSYKGKLDLVAMAVQEPDLDYVDPQTGKIATRQDQADFAADYLGADIIFWATSAPWLQMAKAPRTGQ